jgi:diguanylate cyclase (GGDEF)-like protein/PAS domain S-box-containing protein
MIKRTVAAVPRPGIRASVLAICGALVLGTAFAVSQNVSGHLADAAIHEASRTTQSLVLGSVGPIVAAAVVGGPDAPSEATVNTQLQTLVGQGQLLRIKVWARDGTILYSDLAALQRSQFEVDDDLIEAFDGQSTTSISGTDDPENVFERGLADRLLSVYLPIRAADGRVVAAFETYQDAAPIEADIAATSRDVLLIVGAMGLLLLGLLLVAFSGVARRISSQNSRLREQARVQDVLAGDLRRSSQRFEALVRNAADVQAIVNGDGRMAYESPSLRRVLGHTPDGRDGRRLTDDIHPRDAERVTRILDELATDPGGEATIEFRARHADASWRTVEAVVRNLVDDPAVAGLVVNYRDVTEQRSLERELRRKAFRDPLTGLANRALFSERLEHALARSASGGNPPAVLFIDLDDFKTVNDSLGHRAGDRLLVEVAARFATAIASGDTLARMGGDEFAILLEDIRDAVAPVELGRRILAGLAPPLRPDGKEVFVRASIGIAVARNAAEGAGTLLRNADAAMYTAKSRGKHAIEVYEPGMHESALRRLALKGDLERAVERGELSLAYQPILDLERLAVVGAEALLRWQHPTRGLIPPSDFVPLAEETGAIVPIGRWVLEEAAREAATWPTAAGGLSLSINVSPRQLAEPDLAETVRNVLDRAGLEPAQVMLELTEGTLIGNTAPVAIALGALEASGVQLAIDDFGTGFSSLSYLARLPIDALKIDRSFVVGLEDGGRGRAVVAAIVRLAESLGLSTIAEGIETQAQLEALRSLGAGSGQGFLFAPALEPAAFAAYVAGRLRPAAARRVRVPGRRRGEVLLPEAATP